MTTGVALPDGDYLRRIGEVAYTASSLEWMLLGDLPGLAERLPSTLRLEDLEPREMGRIARRVEQAARELPPGSVRDYLMVTHAALVKVSRIRNAVLHARPATHQVQGQRLQRAEVVDGAVTGERFWIDDAWLDEAVGQLRQAVAEVAAARAATEMHQQHAGRTAGQTQQQQDGGISL